MLYFIKNCVKFIFINNHINKLFPIKATYIYWYSPKTCFIYNKFYFKNKSTLNIGYMKRNLLLFSLIILLSLTLFNFDAKTADGFIEKGFKGIIIGKIYDFIFGEQNSSSPDNLKRRNEIKNNKGFDNDKINNNCGGKK